MKSHFEAIAANNIMYGSLQLIRCVRESGSFMSVSQRKIITDLATAMLESVYGSSVQSDELVNAWDEAKQLLDACSQVRVIPIELNLAVACLEESVQVLLAMHATT